MTTTRRFLLASSLARLIEKERGGHRVTEGYFPTRSERSSSVQVTNSSGSLVLITVGRGAVVEERTEVPRSQAEALIDVTAGQVEYLSADLTIGPHVVQVHRFVRPGPLDLIAVSFERDADAWGFHPLLWFGPEVSTEASYQNRMIASEGLPAVPEVPVSDAAVNDLLDMLDNHFGSAGHQPPAERLGGSPRSAPSLAPETSGPETTAPDDGFDIESSVIRELARSLRPQPR